MKHGDFTELAKFYGNRPGYSKVVLTCLRNHIFNTIGEGKAADVGAGTGKLTENLAEIGLCGFAVEPNEAMRQEGEKAFKDKEGFVWSEGCAEETGLADNSAN